MSGLVMRRIGLILLLISFFGAAFVTVRHGDDAGRGWHTIEWGWYFAALIMGVVGVVVMRISARGAVTLPHKVEADMSAMNAGLNSLVETLGRWLGDRETIGVYDVHWMIDRELSDAINMFVEARMSLVERFGLQEYANVMSEFAGAERNINRAWSASADGYIDEVWYCIERAREQMSKALELLRGYEVSASRGGSAIAVPGR